MEQKARNGRKRHQQDLPKDKPPTFIFGANSFPSKDPPNDNATDVPCPSVNSTIKERAKDVIVFDPADVERPMGMNMLDIISQDPDIRKQEMDRAALDATEIFIKIFGDEIFGPRIQHYFRNGCLTLWKTKKMEVRL